MQARAGTARRWTIQARHEVSHASLCSLVLCFGCLQGNHHPEQIRKVSSILQHTHRLLSLLFCALVACCVKSSELTRCCLCCCCVLRLCQLPLHSASAHEPSPPRAERPPAAQRPQPQHSGCSAAARPVPSTTAAACSASPLLSPPLLNARAVCVFAAVVALCRRGGWVTVPRVVH